MLLSLARLLRACCLRLQVSGVALTMLFASFGGLGSNVLRAQVQRVPAAAAGLLESGAPPFSVLSTDALGLTSPPTDIHLLPDGRVLLFAARQIAIGDGVRWDVFRLAPEARTPPTVGVAVDANGEIYVGVPGGFAKVEFGSDGYWRLAFVAAWPATENPRRPVPRNAIEVGDEWFWHSSSGSIISWRPNQPAVSAGQTNMVEHIFRFQDHLYVSDRTEGELFRLENGQLVTVPLSVIPATDNALTAALRYDDGSMLVGTYGHGLRLFDGKSLRPFVTGGMLGSAIRIDDLCPTDDNQFAAAVENYGIVFFDRTGRITQVLDRSLDHRLSRVKRLLTALGGVIWALLDDGVGRVQFPSRVSNYGPIIGPGLTSAHPYRFEGKLWIVADGKAHRAHYDDDGRVTRLDVDTPSDAFVFAFSAALGVPVVGTEHGAYYRGEPGWIPFAPAVENLRVLDNKAHDGRWLYGARNEIGWLARAGTGVLIQRIPVPGLNNVYTHSVEANGNIWLELGNGRLGRIRFEQDRPHVDLFDSRQGVPDGWAQVFEIGGVIGFNIADQILRFDETSQRLVPDPEFSRRYPGLSEIVGRPSLDANGRLWIAANGGIQVLEPRNGEWFNLGERMPPGLLPFNFTFEENGIVWMHAERHLSRYDPNVQLTPSVPLRAIITHIDLVTSGRTLFAVDRELPTLNYADNSLSAHFMAPGNPFHAPVTFEIMLEGAGREWVSNGSSGSAVFNRLKEGKYTLRVRPRSGESIGAEATLAFAIAPPWFRSPLAYFVYACFVVGAGLLVVWLVTVLQRRENARLERLVAQRTAELKASNQLLATQVDEIRMLSQAITQSPVSVIITRPDGVIVFANARAAELTGHSVTELPGQSFPLLYGNPRSLDAAAAAASAASRGESWHGQLERRRQDGTVVHLRTTVSPIRGPDSSVKLHLILEEDVSGWLADQERRRRLEAQLFQAQKLESVGTLAGGIAHDFNNILTGILGYCELARFNVAPDTELMGQLQEIRSAGLRAKDLVAQILTFSRRASAELVPLDLAKPVGEALRLIRASTPATIALNSQLVNGIVRADSTQVQQVVLNLCTNAVHAIGDKPGRIDVVMEKIEVDARLAAEIPDLAVGSFVRLTVTDTGHGMSEATLSRIFDPFFTTKPQGEGTGLGLSIVQGILATHHGALRVRSQPERGSTFELFFPLSPDPAPPPPSTEPAPRGNAQEILVVDDELSVAAFVTARLEQLGYRVANFRDPREAVTAYLAAPSRYQAIVTDLTMPHLTGVDLIQRVRSTGRIVPAVIITGYGRDAGGTKLASLPRCQVLFKPFSGEDLARILNLVLNS